MGTGLTVRQRHLPLLRLPVHLDDVSTEATYGDEDASVTTSPVTSSVLHSFRYFSSTTPSSGRLRRTKPRDISHRIGPLIGRELVITREIVSEVSNNCSFTSLCAIPKRPNQHQ